jgi:hypothetical protein
MPWAEDRIEDIWEYLESVITDIYVRLYRLDSPSYGRVPYLEGQVNSIWGEINALWDGYNNALWPNLNWAHTRIDAIKDHIDFDIWPAINTNRNLIDTTRINFSNRMTSIEQQHKLDFTALSGRIDNVKIVLSEYVFDEIDEIRTDVRRELDDLKQLIFEEDLLLWQDVLWRYDPEINALWDEWDYYYTMIHPNLLDMAHAGTQAKDFLMVTFDDSQTLAEPVVKGTINSYAWQIMLGLFEHFQAKGTEADIQHIQATPASQIIDAHVHMMDNPEDSPWQDVDKLISQAVHDMDEIGDIRDYDIDPSLLPRSEQRERADTIAEQNLWLSEKYEEY